MLRIRTLFAAGLCAAAASTVAFADSHTAPSDSSGLYIIGRIGSALPIEQDVTVSNAFGSGSGEYDPDGGIGFQGAIGHHFADGWRAEVSYTHLRGNDGELTLEGFGPPFELDGTGKSHTVLFNVLKTVGTFDTFLGPVSPFVGAGIGFSHLDRSDIDLVFAPGFLGSFPSDNTDTVFAAAAHVGFESKLAPGVTLSSQWSFQYADEAEFENAFAGFADLNRDAQVQIMSFTGLRFDF
jgi:opacity protein-like surface antigen